MKKLTLFIGMGAGFIAGSWAGRAPYERLELTVRETLKQPKVQDALETAADSAREVRDASLDAASEKIDQVSDTAAGAINQVARDARRGTQRVGAR